LSNMFYTPLLGIKKLSENDRNELCLKEVRARQFATEHRPRSYRHGPNQVFNQALTDDLGDSRRTLVSDRAHPQGVLAHEAHRPQGRQLEEDAQRHHLPDAERLPVGPTPRAVRPQEHRPRLVPALGPRRHLREDLGGAGRRVRRTRRGGLAMAIGRRDAGQGPVRGGKRRARIPPIAARKGPRRVC
jgi:hypothetical protein